MDGWMGKVFHFYNSLETIFKNDYQENRNKLETDIADRKN